MAAPSVARRNRVDHRLEGLDGGHQCLVAALAQRLAKALDLPAVLGAEAIEVALQTR